MVGEGGEDTEEEIEVDEAGMGEDRDTMIEIREVGTMEEEEEEASKEEEATEMEVMDDEGMIEMITG